ncbi:MAG: S1 family peptidase [Myxococcota bacterium]
MRHPKLLVVTLGLALACTVDPAAKRDDEVPTDRDAGGAHGSDGGSSGGVDAGGVVDGPDAGGPSDAGWEPDPLCQDGPNKIDLRRHTVVNGTREPTHVPLTLAQQTAVVGITSDTPYDAFCTGTLISDKIILTAQHCTDGTAGDNFYALFGPDDGNPQLGVPSVRKREHPTLDMALIELAYAPATQIDVTPIPIALEDLTSADFGITVEQAGYGRTQTGNSDGRYFVAEVLYGFEGEADKLVVNGEGVHGVCYGDSGGPSMRIATAGDTRVIGALSWGDDSCVGLDRYTRTDVARAWIEEWTGPTPGAGPQPCGFETSEGHCALDGTSATWCENDLLQHAACGSGQRCGWSTAASGWRCVAPAEDPCQGLLPYGECDGQVLRWCRQGELLQRDCSSCGERCVLGEGQVGYVCVPSNCGDVDYRGRCNGEVAEWCNEQQQLQTRDCAAQGLDCRYVNPQVGYFCGDPGNCGDVDYLGRCEGDVAQWCRNETLRSKDCAADGQVCRYVDDETGYYCADP